MNYTGDQVVWATIFGMDIAATLSMSNIVTSPFNTNTYLNGSQRQALITASRQGHVHLLKAWFEQGLVRNFIKQIKFAKNNN
jgi:hypothetical protein